MVLFKGDNMASISRVLSNKFIKTFASGITGRIFSIGSGTDEDGEGGYYRNYFSNCNQYFTSEVSPSSGCDITIDVHDMSKIDDGYFDCVFCSGVLEHVAEPDSALTEITRILKTGGTLLLGVPFRQGLHLEPTDYWRFTKYGIEYLLEKKGYKVERIEAIDAEDPSFPVAYWISAKNHNHSFLRKKTFYGCVNTFFDKEQLLKSQPNIDRMYAFDREFQDFIDQKEINGLRKWEHCTLLEAFRGDFSGKRVLDVGCGRSLFSAYLTTLGAHVVTLDLPVPLQEQETAINRRNRFGVSHYNGSMLDIPFETGSFDLVLSISAIEHLHEEPSNPLQSRNYGEFVNDTIMAVKEMARVVTPGGYLFITSDLFDPTRQKTDNWRPAAGVTCAYQFGDFKKIFIETQRAAGFYFDRPFSYDFDSIGSDPGRATYRGRYFTTFTCLMRKDSNASYVSQMGQNTVTEMLKHGLSENLPSKSTSVLPANYVVNIVIADEGWILERCAREIERLTGYIKVSREPDPTAAINYYINYSAYRGRQPGIDIAFFTHIEERVPEAAEKFFQIAREVDVCVCMSELYADALRNKGINNVHIITPGVDLESFRPVVHIGVIGRTYPTGRKGEALISEVMDEPGIEWHFTGEGWPGNSIKYATDQMPHFYNSVDYILVSSYYEGGPMSLLEALACGKEVIAPAIGFVTEYPHIEFKKGDAGDLRRVLKGLVAKRNTLRNSVIECSWQNWAEQHDSLFRELLAGKNCPTEIKQNSSLRVLLAIHSSESHHQGGPSIRVVKTQKALEQLGVSVDITSKDLPDPTGYDVVHVFNVWSPNIALAKLQHLKRFKIPVVFSPIYLNLSETAWAFMAIPALFSQAQSPEELQYFLSEVEKGTLRVGDMSRFGNNEIFPGYLNQVREMLQLSDYLITLSNYEQNCLKAVSPQLPPCSLVRNAAESAQLSGISGDLFTSEYGVRDYVLCVGRIERRKNQLMLLQALEGTNLPIVLIGNSVEPDYLELIKRKAGSNVTLVGYLPHDSTLLESAFAGAKVFVLPSWSEGAPLSALEAAATGIPLVLSDRSSEKEYFGDLARYCDPGCLKSIRTAVLEAYAGDNEEEPRRRLLQKKVRSEYSWETVAVGTLQAYRQVLNDYTQSERRPSVFVNHSVAPSESRKLEIGSGMNPHPGYEHMDIRADLPHIEHVHDIYKPLPFAEETFDEILSWSVIEHISWRNVREVISNWKDVLKPSGKLEIWVPDLEYLCTMYKERQMDEHLDKEYILTAHRVLGHYSPAIWAMIKMYGGQDYHENFHSAMYDWDTMKNLLITIGFKRVERIEPYYGLHIIAYKCDTNLQNKSVICN